METIVLNNGVEIPALGFGVFQTPPDDLLILHKPCRLRSAGR
jgi:diketogulonate reductase-like aldo/keto reductase